MNKRARTLLERASNTQITEDNVVIIIKELLMKYEINNILKMY